MTFREAYQYGTERLTDAAVPDPAIDSWYLLEEVTGIKRSEFYLREEEELLSEDQLHFENALRERENRVPLQYILGRQAFMGLTFKVNSGVLIPRQDTETLVEQALAKAGEIGKEHPEVLDLCTGSGCIAVSLKKNRPLLSVTGSDISKAALLTAKENGKLNGTDVSWVRSDLFDNLPGKYDLIVSNPPYIRTAVIPTLQPEVADYEPKEALDGHEDGLHFYRRIAVEAAGHLEDKGVLLFEIGSDQGEEVKALLLEQGFEGIEIKRDLAGLCRVVIAERGAKEHV